jgi:hypothetical protein
MGRRGAAVGLIEAADALADPLWRLRHDRGGRVSSERVEDRLEGRGASELGGIEGGANVGFGLGGPHRAIAVGDLSLDDAGAEDAFRAVVGVIAESSRTSTLRPVA